MEAVRYALQAVLPVALLLLLGCLMRKRGLVSEHFAAEGDHLCMRLLFPVLLFRSISQGELALDSCLRSIAFAYGIIAVSLLAGILLIPRLVRDRNQIAVVIQSLYRGNFTLYGIPLCQLLGGAGAADAASAIAAATLPVLNIAAVVMYAWYAGRERRNWAQLLKGILKNPILWGVFLGLAFRPFHAVLPGPLESLTASLAAMASPLAFLTLGTKLYGGRVPAEQRKLTGAVVLYKLLIMPVLVLPVAIWGFGLRGPELIPVFLFAAAPSAITTYQLAGEYGADDLLAGSIVTISTLFSSVTLCVFVAVLKNLSFI